MSLQDIQLVKNGAAPIMQESRRSLQGAFLFHGENADAHIHSVYTSKPEGMQLGQMIHLNYGRRYMLCKNAGAAAVTVGKLVTAGFTNYDIDATNEIIIATSDNKYIEWYLGASGTTISDLTTIVGGFIYVTSSTGAGIIRRIVEAVAFTHTVSGTDYTAYRVLLDIPLTTSLAATSVLKIKFLVPNVTLYDSAADNAGLIILGASASDTSAAQNKFFFVQTDGITVLEADGTAAVAGKEVMGSDTGAAGDGNCELQDETDVLPAVGVAIEAIADGSLGLVQLQPHFGF